MEPVGYVNGRYVPASQVVIPVTDPGLAWGAVITDRVRTFNGRPFRLEEHLRRFRKSCEFARVPQPKSDSGLAAIIERVSRENFDGPELSIVCLATPGPNLIVYSQPLDVERITNLQRAGARLVTASVPAPADPRIKHRSRLSWWIASEQVRERDPHAEALFVDPATGHVLETPTANVLAVIGGVLCSPPLGCVLPGVSLGVVLELAGRLAIPFAERSFTVAELVPASEILLTNTTFCVAGVSTLDGRPVQFPGPLLNRLTEAWSDLVGVDLRRPPGS